MEGFVGGVALIKFLGGLRFLEIVDLRDVFFHRSHEFSIIFSISIFITFYRSRLPAAIVPPPGLGKIICMRKICKKFDARSMQVYFFATYCLKGLISPTTNQNETPTVQNNQNLALQGTKRDPICAKRTPK